jgi:uncharacterized protein (TIGR02444 family)
MRQPRPELETDSWAFALSIYAGSGVAEACLALQNEVGVDVMLLMMVTFAAAKHRMLLSPEEIKALDQACRPWREQIVWRLRTVRTELKTGPQPAPSNETEQFRSQIKALELVAEKLENKLLAECLPLKPAEQEAVKPEQLRAVLNDVVLLFAQARKDEPRANLASSIDTIVEAAIEKAS